MCTSSMRVGWQPCCAGRFHIHHRNLQFICVNVCDISSNFWVKLAVATLPIHKTQDNRSNTVKHLKSRLLVWQATFGFDRKWFDEICCVPYAYSIRSRMLPLSDSLTQSNTANTPSTLTLFTLIPPSSSHHTLQRQISIDDKEMKKNYFAENFR